MNSPNTRKPKHCFWSSSSHPASDVSNGDQRHRQHPGDGIQDHRIRPDHAPVSLQRLWPSHRTVHGCLLEESGTFALLHLPRPPRTVAGDRRFSHGPGNWLQRQQHNDRSNERLTKPFFLHPMGFIAVAGCVLLAAAMSAVLTEKPSKA